jgi:hypothetical protein
MITLKYLRWTELAVLFYSLILIVLGDMQIVDLKLFILAPAFPIIPDPIPAPDLTLKLSHVK